MATVKSMQVPTNQSINLKATCFSDAEQHIQFSCNGQTVELTGTGQDVEMTQDGDPYGFINTGDETELTISFWSSANDDPFVFGPEVALNPVRPGWVNYWAGSQDTENQESYSCSMSVSWSTEGSAEGD
jgi:hypothetical protein